MQAQQLEFEVVISSVHDQVIIGDAALSIGNRTLFLPHFTLQINQLFNLHLIFLLHRLIILLAAERAIKDEFTLAILILNLFNLLPTSLNFGILSFRLASALTFVAVPESAHVGLVLLILSWNLKHLTCLEISNNSLDIGLVSRTSNYFGLLSSTYTSYR